MADGFVSHPTNSNPRYLREVCLPALAEGASERGRDLEGDAFEAVIGTPVVTAASETRRAGRAGTPTSPAGILVFHPRLRPHARALRLGRPRPRLRDLIRHDRWDDLAGVLSDEVLETLVPCGTFAELPGLLLERFGGLGQGIVVSPPPDAGDDASFAGVVEAIRAG